MRISRALLTVMALAWCVPASATPVTWDWKFQLFQGSGDPNTGTPSPFTPVAAATPFDVVMTFDPTDNGCAGSNRGFFSPTGYARFQGHRYDIAAAGIEVNDVFRSGCSPDPSFVSGQNTDYVIRWFFSGLTLPMNYLDPNSGQIPIFSALMSFGAPFNGVALDPVALRQLLQHGSTFSMYYNNDEVVSGVGMSIDVVPEPSTWLLLGTAIVAASVLRRRTRASESIG